jgi:capsular exopolysaccharide synthesis family protein
MVGTNLIQVRMTGAAVNENQRVALAQIVNAVADAFEEFSRTNIRSDLRDNISSLVEERDRLATQRDTIRRQMERASDAQNLEEQRTVIANEVRMLSTQMIPAKLYQVRAKADLDTFNQQDEEGTIGASPEVVQAVDTDPMLRRLRDEEINHVTEEQRLLTTKFGTDHPAYQSVKTRLENVRKQAEGREEILREQVIALLRSARVAGWESATDQVNSIQQQLNRAIARDKDLQTGITTIARLAQTEGRLGQDIATYDRRLLDLRALARSEQQVDLAIRADPPKQVSMPKWRIMGPLGVVLGLAVGLGLAFLLEFIDTSVKSPSDISRRVDLPLLGMIPHADDVEEEIEDLRLAFLTHPNSLIGEAFRQIRTCLMFSGPPAQRRSLLVTSPLPEDGRTTVAMNLAAGCAQGGRKVLVVDANFRQPAIRALFSDCPSGGLSSALVGQGRWEDLVHEVQPNLHVVPAGILPPNPAELLGSEQMRQIIEQMVENYDQVFIDGAPCLVVSDSAILATLVDGVILTVRAEANTYGIVQRTRDILQRVGAHIVGVALNGVRVTAGGYFRESYETFYDYHGQEKLPAP